jgi:hypothetical protein
VTRLANEVFALPGQLAADRKRTVVVALDEFQAIDAFNGGSVEHALRAAAQLQRRVGYVFAGSEPSLMEKMIGPSGRSTSRSGDASRQDRPDVFAGFIETRSQKRHQRRGGLGAAIVDLAGNLPYDVQRLAHETWDDIARGRQNATLDHLHATLARCSPSRHDLRSRVAAADAGPARGAARRRCCRMDASCCLPTRARVIVLADPRACRHR